MTTSTLSLPEPSTDRIDVSSQTVESLAKAVNAWPGVSLSVQASRALSFTVRDRTFGCVRPDGFVDVPLPSAIGDALLAERGSALSAMGTGDACRGVRIAAVRDASTFVLRLGYLYRRIVGSRDGVELDRIAAELDDLHVDGALRDAYDAVLARRHRTVRLTDLPRGYVLPTPDRT